MISAGAVCLGLVLGVLLVQYTPARGGLRVPTLAALIFATLTVAGAAASVAGWWASFAVVVATPSGYLLRRMFDDG